MFFHCFTNERINTGVLKFGFLLSSSEQCRRKIQQPHEKTVYLFAYLRHAEILSTARL
jgi:hypothetical protein